MDVLSPDNLFKTNPSFESSSERQRMDLSTVAKNLGRKRKHPPSNDDILVNRVLESLISTDQESSTGDNYHGIPFKKHRLEFDGTSPTWSRLPMEVWQYVFSFLDPKTLGLLLRINRSFNSYLTTSENCPRDTLAQGVLNPMNAASIWSFSRKLFYPGMPRPLINRTELEMWQTSSAPLGKELGVEEARIIWPFAIRTCSECLLARTRKEMDVLLSSLPTSLLPGLCFALVTSSMHVVSSVAVKSNQVPIEQMSKYYYDNDIQCLLGEFERVKALGPATLEEWTKGLESERATKMADIARWEQWEKSGGLQDVRGKLRIPIKHLLHDSKPSDEIPAMRDVSDRGSAEGKSYDDMGNIHFDEEDSDRHFRTTPANLEPPGHPSPEHTQVQQDRAARSLSDVNEAKTLRKLEIERRCLELHPPLTAAILSHMDSFLAAIQIPKVLTDRDWDILLPRLLLQRDAAEKKEDVQLKNLELLETKSEERRLREAQLKEAKASLDRQWDDVQRPIRDQIALYAEEFIDENWKGGSVLTKDKCAQFAANVLTHVRSRFYAHIQEEDDVARASGNPVRTDSPDLPPTRKLILENMKWVFEAKVKPITEKYQKELFFCNGCDNNSRTYGFEGVIQHYAAKHTSALSRGSVVVYWRAEWPEKPPFHPNPNAAKALLHASAQSGFTQAHCYTGQQNTPTVYSMATPEQRHRMMSESLQSPHSFGHSPFGGPYAFGPYQPPSPRMSPYYPTPQSSYVFPVTPVVTTSAYDQPPPVYSPSSNVHASPAMYPSHILQARHAYPSPAYVPSSPYSQQVSSDGKPSVLLQQGDSERRAMHQNQFNDMARIARDVWNATSGIKDLPASIRAHTLIHHVFSTCKRRLNLDVSIFLFADGLNYHPQMKPMRSLHSLVCKRCTDKENDHIADPRSRNTRSYNLQTLIGHFNSTHMEHTGSGPVTLKGGESRSWDWKTDMILLPDSSTIESSLRAPGMEDAKLQIISQALQSIVPNLFRVQLQTVEPTHSQATSYRREPILRSNIRPEHIDWEGDYLDHSSSYTFPSQHPIDDKSGLWESSDMSIRKDDPGDSARPGYFEPSSRTVFTRENRPSDTVPMDMDERELREASGLYTIRRRDASRPKFYPSRFPENETRLRVSELPESPNRRYVWLTSDQYDATSDLQDGAQNSNENSRYPPGYSLGDAVFLKHENPKPLTDEVGEARLYATNMPPGQETNIKEDLKTNPLSSRKRFHLQISEEPAWYPALTTDDIVEHDLSASRDDYKSNRVWKQRRDLVPVREIDVRRQNRAPGSPEMGTSRFGRKLSGPVESRRPLSRFDRYEAQRQQEPLRPRSRSSSIKEGTHSDSHFFHEQPQWDQTLVPRYYVDQQSRSFTRADMSQTFTPTARQDSHEYTQDFGGTQRYYDNTTEQ
ncbi:Spectrin beta chain, non-erythrocytic 2 [Talaromyces islandicus]|uniref:Spectrin beta chain, non-erythrocytic 2 n=1 Tax=Talaromyces islandicus TaxID=28573 RepID=A0A0U1M4A7_TALIS|nr:Spectrin beta chain, non-erythrocytic 2 [Talaromyces islandicus]